MKLTANNHTVVQLFALAYKQDPLDFSKIVFDVEDRKKLMEVYTYLIQLDKKQDIYAIMQENLDYMFDYKVKIEGEKMTISDKD